ncbi:heterokaryon incompatibility protein-domain-containing protein [Trametes polyzona]|nr:heterokaryon incompatibility protein-domain-containing protein [Trametes polyzona]
MPRFMNTWTGKFEWHVDASKVHYAILSHTWRAECDGGEQSFADVLKLQEKAVELSSDSANIIVNVALPSVGPSSLPFTIFSIPETSDKIVQFCKVAREAGYKLIWLDSCCIDKTSSAEPTEAINSMYEWYRLADICYVYLEDVPDGDNPRVLDEWGQNVSQFSKSRWHRRGWTLQELIAPRHVVFLTRTWCVLGTRMGLASSLEKITGINSEVLIGQATVTSISIARRMSWAAERGTTRVEDEAYSLLGIFGVHMSPIYGEGRNAFLRLQEEIIKTIPDQTIFAWGHCCAMRSPQSARRCSWPTIASGIALLMPSPRGFYKLGDIRPISATDFARRLGMENMFTVPPLQCSFTPEGVRLELFCIHLSPDDQASRTISRTIMTPHRADDYDICTDCRNRGAADMLALLQCEDTSGSILALPVRIQENSHVVSIDTFTPCDRHTLAGHLGYRTVRLHPDVLATIRSRLSPTPLPLFLPHHDPLTNAESFAGALSLEMGLRRLMERPDGCVRGGKRTDFIPARCLEELKALGFFASPLQQTWSGSGTLTVDVSLTSSVQKSLSGGSFKHAIRIQVRVLLDSSHPTVFFTVGNDMQHTDYPHNPDDPERQEAPTRDGLWSTRMTCHVWGDHPKSVGGEGPIAADPHWDEPAHDRRLLRIKLKPVLYLRSDRSHANDTKDDLPDVQLIIELSERFRCTTQQGSMATDFEQVDAHRRSTQALLTTGSESQSPHVSEFPSIDFPFGPVGGSATEGVEESNNATQGSLQYRQWRDVLRPSVHPTAGLKNGQGGRVESEIERNQAPLSDFDSEMDGLRVQIASQQRQVETMSTRIAAISSQLDSLSAHIATELATLNSRSETLPAQIDAHSSRITSIVRQLEECSAWQDNYSEMDEQTHAELAVKLSTQHEALSTRMSALSVQVAIVLGQLRAQAPRPRSWAPDWMEAWRACMVDPTLYHFPIRLFLAFPAFALISVLLRTFGIGAPA